MELIYRGSFRRDFKILNNKELAKSLKAKIDEVKAAKDVSQISHLKKLRNYLSRYKIEIAAGNKTFWVLCLIRKNKIEFIRLKSEIYFKKQL